MNHVPAVLHGRTGRTVYMAVLKPSKRTVKLSKMLMKSTRRPHRLPQQTRIGHQIVNFYNKGRCMVHTLAGAAGVWFIQTVLN